jgi:hypothetical protein
VNQDGGGFKELEADPVLGLAVNGVAKPLYMTDSCVELDLMALERHFNRLHGINGGGDGRHDQRAAATDVQQVCPSFDFQRTPQGADDFESDPASAIT